MRLMDRRWLIKSTSKKSFLGDHQTACNIIIPFVKSVNNLECDLYGYWLRLTKMPDNKFSFPVEWKINSLYIKVVRQELVYLMMSEWKISQTSNKMMELGFFVEDTIHWNCVQFFKFPFNIFITYVLFSCNQLVWMPYVVLKWKLYQDPYL